MEALEAQLSYQFRNPELLQQALTHTTLQTPTSSPFNSRKRTCDHLKILGDAVIKLLTSQYAICVSLPNEKVHKIVRIKDNLSNRYCQNLVGRTLQLEEKGIVITNLQQDQIFSHLDTFVKSLFGAIFLDAGGSQKKGFISCWKVFLKLWKPVISTYDGARPLISCFPEPKFSSQEFLKERFSNFKLVDLKLLEDKIGFKFLKNPHLLEASMTHDSIDMFRNAVDNPDPSFPEFVHFQNLEFLGDSVLELVIMEYLYLRSSSADPLGQMLFFNRDTSSKLVSSRFQIQVAKKLKLEDFVIKPPEVGLASYDDFVESLIGSIYIHGRAVGLRACAKVVLEMWGLEPSLEEEDGEQCKEKKSVPENVVAEKKIVEKRVEKPVAPQTPSSPVVKTSGNPKARSPSMLDDLQSILDYKFANTSFLKFCPAKIDVSTTEARMTSLNLINVSRNLQTIGKRAIALTIAEYVTGICHSSQTADLSAKTKATFTQLVRHLSSDELLSEIFARLKLSKYFNIQEEKIPNPTTSPADVMHLLFGIVFIDSLGDPSTIQKLFWRLWQSYANGTKPATSLISCFPDTSEKQQVFRAAVNAKISETMLKKICNLMAHTFTHKNLLEQALTDEKSQGYAKQCHDAYPLGNPFGLQVLGKCAIDLFVAQRCYVNTLAEPGNFAGVLLRLDQSLFNVLKTRFHNLERYYANQFRYPFPPKKNPRAPYEAMLAALYVDVGGGMKGMQQIYLTIEKACPSLLVMKKGKAVKTVPEDAVDGHTGSPVSANGEQESVEERRLGNSESTDSSRGSPLASCKSAHEELNNSVGSQGSSTAELTTGGNIPLQPAVFSDPTLNYPLLCELQTKLAYKFVNPLLLKIVLEVDIPIGVIGDSSQISSRTYFEIFEILGKRALNLLVTEYALESLPMKAKKSDIPEHFRLKMQTHREHLLGPIVMGMIAESLELTKYVFVPTSGSITPFNASIITALLGAVFIDSRANYLKICTLFNKLWKSSINNPNQTQLLLVQSFPMTSEAQAKIRSATGTLVNDTNWKKFYKKLGYTFKNKNLLEQALTDENSQELARTKYNAHPTGNPFALRLLGQAVIQLVIAYKTLPASLNTQVASYTDGLCNIEKALFNSFKNNFLGTEKYYAWLKQKKNQQFPPNNNLFGPYEAIMGAVFIDSGAGNPGLDSVGVVITHRNIGVKAGTPCIAVFTAVPALPLIVTESIPGGITSVSCTTPTPSTSSAISESLNTSFSSKCAANFSISPAQMKKSPPKPVQSLTPAQLDSDTASISSQKPSPTKTPSPKKSPKKEQKKSYASVLANGKTVQTNNKLIIAVTNATSQIQALKREQEYIDHTRKLSLEREKLQKGQLQDQDQISITSSGRSRCPSTSTITSVGSQPNPLLAESGQKRKRGSRGTKNQNKKAKAQPHKQVAITAQQIYSERVSVWCQNQLDRMPPSPPVAGSDPSSCTTPEVYQQRSMVHQQQSSSSASSRRQGDDPEERSPQFASPTHSAYNTHVPVNMVSGYRKSASANADHHHAAGTSGSEKGKKSEKKIGPSLTPGNCDSTDDPSSSLSLFGVLKWTSLILGVAFLLKRYTQRK